MSDMNPQDLIIRYLAESKIMQLATSHDNKPWICSLHFAADNKGTIYWITKPTTRHSEDIASNANVAITIVVKTDKPLIALQSEGIATIIEDPKLLTSAMDIYIEQQGTDRAFADRIVAGTDEHKLYQFTPTHFTLYDGVNFAAQPVQEWVIN